MSIYLISYSILFVFISLVILFRSKNILEPSLLLLAVYYYGTSGPLWAQYLYDTPLPLVVYHNIDYSVILFMSAIIGIGLAQFIPSKIIKPIPVKGLNLYRVNRLISILVSILNMFAILVLILKSSLIIMFDKGVLLLDSDFFLFHRNYTLFMFILVPIYYYISCLCRLSNIEYQSRLQILNILVYIIYMLLTQERDFFLVLLIFLVVYNIILKKISYKKIVVYFVFSVLGFSSLFVIRVLFMDTSVNIVFLESLLNQGSNITITSNIIGYVEDNGFFYGYTYFQSLVNLLPSFIYRFGIPLTDWFVLTFFPSSSSGYGFSLEAEAYMNGGYILCIIQFLILSYTLNILFLYVKKKNMFLGSLFCSYFPFLLYSLRGDSLMLFKSNFLAFFLLIFIFLISIERA